MKSNEEGKVTFMKIFILATIIVLANLVIGGIINSKEPYACPNCGHIFKKKWYNLMFKPGPMVRDGSGELRLKCPSCNKVDFCLHTNQMIDSK